MKVAVFGLGYVGAVTAALLAKQGNTVIGIDVNPMKVQMINAGRSSVVEPGLEEAIAEAVGCGRLCADTDPQAAGSWQVALVCVGTPSGTGGALDPKALVAVLNRIGAQIAARADFPVVAIRSTVTPHLLQQIVIPALTSSVGRAPGDGYGLVTLPEFLREGSSISDFFDPPFTLVGESDVRAGNLVAQLFGFLKAPIIRTGLGEAMMVKYASNVFHALKVAFANEIGTLCAYDGLDSRQVMDTFCQDHKLNISARYLSPGFAFGGSCLPKDLRALNHRARQADLDTLVLNAVLPSNRAHLERCIELVLRSGRRHVGVLGISFKPGTDDLRESPMISLIEALLGKGRKISIYDGKVNLAQLTGSNRHYIETIIPHIASLLKPSLQEVVRAAEVLVIGNADAEFAGVVEQVGPGQLVIDFCKPLELTPMDAGLELAVINF